mgnify:CR=1 FL=1|jgi:TM2 domain-containing membrane protein YozV
MNTLNKILVVLTIILVIALSIMTYKYFTEKQTAENNSEMVLNNSQEIQDLNKKITELEKELKAKS